MESGIGLKPLHDRLIVRRLKTENVSSGGIVIPDAAIDPPDVGKVLAVGPGKDDGRGGRIQMSIQVGDTIMFGKYVGNIVKHKDEELVSMPECDVMAVVDDAPDNISFQ